VRREFKVDESDALEFSELMTSESAWSEDDAEDALVIFRTYQESRDCLLELLSLCNFGLREESRLKISHMIEDRINELA